MKKTSAVTLFLIFMVFGTAIGSTAGAQLRMFVNIPFAFYAGNELLPAGEYIFTMTAPGNHAATGSGVAISTGDSSIYTYMHAIRDDARIPSQVCTITFTGYGGKYFLSKVQNGGIISDLAKIHAERELALAYSRETGGKASETAVVASFTQE